MTLFRASGGVWNEETFSAAAAQPDSAQYGFSVAFTADRAYVGAPGATGGGLVHVYELNGTSWDFARTLVPTDLSDGDRFGDQIAARGRLAAVSSPGRDRVTVFEELADGSLHEHPTLTPFGADDDYGRDLVMSDEYLVVQGFAGAVNGSPTAHVYEIELIE